MASATDIITFIGMPLAVLGVMPILYNTTVTLTSLSKVKRTLKRSRLAAITRADVINHVIEVEFPRFQIAPLDREEDNKQYWSTYEHPSLIPGGSWTIFNWKMHTIGLKTQRIKYADELRQPQADVGFEELISYLLDLGAVPHAAGFRMLRTSGLWVPTGTALLLSPDRHEAVLTIAPLNDSDGHLSLQVRWSRMWKMREKSSLPPYWIRLSGPDEKQVGLDQASNTKSQELCNMDQPDGEMVETELRTESGSSSVKKDVEMDTTSNKNTVMKPADAVRCHFSLDGLHEVFPEHSNHSHSQLLDVAHLEIRKTTPTSTGIWFATAATAIGASSQTILWNYHIPDDLLQFSKKDSIPCGILVLLGIVNESATPEWATQYDDAAVLRDLQFRRMREQSQAMQKENMLPEAQRAAAVKERQMRMHDNFTEDLRERRRTEMLRADTRMIEALQSPKWDNKLVAEHCLTWLKKNGFVVESYDVRRIVEVLLFKMIKDAVFAEAVTTMLDAWRAWAEGGGMCKANYLMLREKQVDFAYASLILSIIRESVTASEGSLAMDLQESVRIWKRVRLG
jgi:hypothetical protein